MQLNRPIGTNQTKQNQSRRNTLRQYRRQRDTCYSHVKYDDKKQIHENIQDPCYQKEVHGALRIANRPQNRTAKIIQHNNGHTRKIDPHIQCCLIQHIIRCSHEPQERFCQCNSDEDHDDAAHQTEQNGCMHSLTHQLFFMCPVISGHHDIRAYGKPDQQIDQ